MNLYELLLKPYENYQTFDIALEATATIFGLLSVFFSIRKNIWVYPTGIISTAIYVYILFVSSLLGDMMINVYYTIMSIYGWVLWSKHSDDNIHINVSRATPKEWLISGAIFIFSLGLVTLVYYYKPL
ncbi:MAG: nicotinamide riboside transporter PnuC, partial [Bergeyella zoohelcum]|nr:nicotinamide riboside transporter PnuC [Bergeyella zoohelcum]